MKWKLLTFTWMLALTPAAVIDDLSKHATEPGEFRFVKTKGAVSLYERWIEFPEGFRTRELRTIFTVRDTPEEIIRLLQNEEQAAEWMKSVSDFRFLGRTDSDTWVTYIRYNVPWPLNDQDCLLKYSQKAEDKVVALRFHTTQYKIPPKEGVKRMENIRGSWLLEPEGPGTTKVTYLVISAQKPVFPRWATDPIVQNNLLDTMNAFVKVLGKS